jgi:uncharacterized Ntn-hydrolase superfamily protein
VPFVRAKVGAVASQAVSNPWLGAAALELLAQGAPPEAALQAALAIDPNPDQRQLHLVDAGGRPAAWTGTAAPDWKGHLTGEGFSVAGNHLAGPAVVQEMAEAYQRTEAAELADRLLAALEAGEAAGGDARGKQSAALLVVRDDPFPHLSLRVDDDPEPLTALRRILDLYRAERLENPRPRSEYLKD